MLPQIVVIYYGNESGWPESDEESTYMVYLSLCCPSGLLCQLRPLFQQCLSKSKSRGSNVFSGVDKKTKASPPEVFWSI